MDSLPSNNPDTILVIEDDKDVRALVRRSLELEGYAVVEAGDGEEGLRIVEQHPDGIDLVLTDIDMPKIDGVTVAMVLAALRPHLGVICMSGGGAATVFQESIGLSSKPFLTKPFSFEALARKTAETLAHAREVAARDSALQRVTRDYLAEGQLVAAVDLVIAGRRLRARSGWGATLPSMDAVPLPHDMEGR
jgi:DNA-binding NtrC family response regulator